MPLLIAALFVLANGASQETVAEPNGSRFGRSVLAIHDIDGDGIAEVAVGAPNARDGRGVVLILSGKTREVAAVWQGPEARSSFGHTLRSIQDVNGDGIDDVLVGYEFWERTELRSGKDGALVHAIDRRSREVIPFGDFDADGAGDLLLTTAPNWEIRSGRTNELINGRSWGQQGGHFDPIGDVNGDGLVDGVYFGKKVVVMLSMRPKDDEFALACPFPERVPSTPLELWPLALHKAVVYGGKLLRAAPAGDLDGDGQGDLLLVMESDGIQSVHGLSLEKRSSDLVTISRPSADSFFPEEPHIGYATLSGLDLDSDGCGDIVLANSKIPFGVQVVAATGKDGNWLEQRKKWTFFQGAQWHVELRDKFVTTGLSFSRFEDADGDGVQDILVGKSDWIWTGTVSRIGSLRLLSGATGKEIWSVAEADYEQL